MRVHPVVLVLLVAACACGGRTANVAESRLDAGADGVEASGSGAGSGAGRGTAPVGAQAPVGARVPMAARLLGKPAPKSAAIAFRGGNRDALRSPPRAANNSIAVRCRPAAASEVGPA